MASNPSSRANPATHAERQVEAYEHKLRGLSDRKIAALMGCSHTTVQNLIRAEATSRVLPLADEYRKQTLDRIEIAIEKLMDEIDAGIRVARNAEVLGKLEERRARMLGADAPVQQEIAATVEARPEVLDLIARARADVQAQEQHLRDDLERP